MRTRRPAVAAPTAVAAALVALAGMAAAGGSLLSAHPVRWRPQFLRSLPQRSGRPTQGAHVSATAVPGPTPRVGGGVPHWVSLSVVVLAAAVGAALLAYVAIRLLRPPGRRPAVPRSAPPDRAGQPDGADDAARARVAAHVDAAVGGLSEETDARAAVIGCWLRLEQAAADAGVTRQPSETSAELAHRVLTSFAVDAEDVARLNRLYRAARYGPGPVGEEQRVAARAALLAVRRGLGAGRERAAAR